MAAQENTQPTFRKKTFTEILSSAAIGKIVSTDILMAANGDKPQIGLHRGKPSIKITKQRLQAYTDPYKWPIIRKFSQGRPMLKDIHSYFVALELKGTFQLGLLDARHIIINFQTEEDYLRFLSKIIWYISDSVMRVFKWTTNFHVDRK